MSRNPGLTVLLNHRLVGRIHMAKSGAITFQYDQSWLDWEHALPISLSLPLREQSHQGALVIAYLENLLPDNQAIRERVAAKVGRKAPVLTTCWKRSGVIVLARCRLCKVTRRRFPSARLKPNR